MQNWSDNTLARGAGVRDRVVRLRLKPKEGGLNLNMPRPVIDAIAKRGEEAGGALLHRYLSISPKGPAETKAVEEAGSPEITPAGGRANLLPQRNRSARHWQGWDFQRWVRLDVLIRTLTDKAPGLVRALGGKVTHATPYSALLHAARSSAPPGHDAPLTPAQAQALEDLLKALGDVSQVFSRHSPDYPDDPIPSADIRVRPTL
jgi:hypothetical protein